MPRLGAVGVIVGDRDPDKERDHSLWPQTRGGERDRCQESDRGREGTGRRANRTLSIREFSRLVGDLGEGLDFVNKSPDSTIDQRYASSWYGRAAGAWS